MRHPSDADLALYASGDLGWVRQRHTEWHVRTCGACQHTAMEFSALRSEGSAFPTLQWNRLAGEMKANIRLGLEAGECVSPRPAGFGSFFRPRVISGSRLAVAGSVCVAVAVLALWFERPGPHIATATQVGGSVLEASETGIQVSEGSRTLRILNRGTTRVSYSVGSRGELGARYVDPNTGNVTITHVYGE